MMFARITARFSLKMKFHASTFVGLKLNSPYEADHPRFTRDNLILNQRKERRVDDPSGVLSLNS